MTKLERLYPDSTKWTLADLTKCDQQGYLRPCQLNGGEDFPGGSVPLVDMCATRSEMVFVLDDDQDLREELVELIRAQGYRVTGLGSSSELKGLAQHVESGCVLLDIRLPGQDGLSVQEWLNSIDSPLPVIFISGVKDVPTVVECMKAGAIEFLSKPFGEMALRRAVNTAIGMSRKRHCMRESQRMVNELINLLTPTELVVAKMIARGYPTKMIANELGRSENTVKIHRHRIFGKLKVSSAASVGNIMRHVATMSVAASVPA